MSTASAAPRIAIIGAGGYVFPIRLAVDILSFPELQGCTFALHDIHAERLQRTGKRIAHVVERHNLPTNVEMTTDRREALRGAKYVIIAFQVGGVEAYAHDVNIPRQYGLDQCVGDTLGPGGVFRGLRTIAVLKDICRDIQDVAPDALIIQYANPMSINCWATNLLGVKTVGLCHSVQGTSRMLIERAGYPYEEVSFKCGGVNHQAWFTAFTHRGRDIYPAIRRTMLEQNPSPVQVELKNGQPVVSLRPGEKVPDAEIYYREAVRTEIMRTFGYFHTESSHHGSEYTPWFRKNADTVNAYIPQRWDYYAISCSYQNVEQQEHLDALINGPLECSEEYGAQIVYAMETNHRRVVHGNVPNYGPPGSTPAQSSAHSIPNLPRECCVEVACLVDANGVQPTVHGPLPPQCAAINRAVIGVQELAVHAGLTGDRDAVHHAVALDPLTGALLTLPQIRSMVEALFAAEAPWLPQFAR
jgi:alpha-galactosidase